jgi:hypothetical protein
VARSYEIPGHRFQQIPGANIYRVDFEGEQEARAFAQAFAGQVLNRTAV